MAVKIAIGKSIYNIACRNGEEERLAKLGEKINQKVNQLSLHLKDADEKTLLVMASLILQEEVGSKSEESDKKEKSDLDDDIYDAVSETMENVTDYIKKFTNRIQNY